MMSRSGNSNNNRRNRFSVVARKALRLGAQAVRILGTVAAFGATLMGAPLVGAGIQGVANAVPVPAAVPNSSSTTTQQQAQGGGSQGQAFSPLDNFVKNSMNQQQQLLKQAEHHEQQANNHLNSMINDMYQMNHEIQQMNLKYQQQAAFK